MRKIGAIVIICALMAPGAFAAGRAGPDGDAIERLFAGVGEAVKPVDTVRALPTFHGNYRVLMPRPAYALYDGGGAGAEWVSAMAEIHTRYKVGSFPYTYVFTMEETAYALPHSRDRGRPLSRERVMEAAGRLGATHIIFQEYHPFNDNKGARYVMELYWLREKATVIRDTVTVDYADFERGLDTLLGRIADAMDPGSRKTSAFGMSVIGNDRAFLEAFGGILAGESEFTKARSSSVRWAADSLVLTYSGLVGVRYAAALLSARAGDYSRAIGHINAVADRSGHDYPALHLRSAEYLRGVERYDDAINRALMAAQVPGLRAAAEIEMAKNHRAKGDIVRARAVYDTIMLGDDACGIAYFLAALTAAQDGDAAGVEEIINRAAERGFGFGGDDYYALGTAFGGVRGHEETAIGYFVKSLGPARIGDRGWLSIADAYSRIGNREAEADIYTHIYRGGFRAHSDTNVYRGRLRLAAGIYDSLGRVIKARDAYRLYWDGGRSDTAASMRLAEILVLLQECDGLPDVLRPHIRGENRRAARQMLRDCRYKVVGGYDIVKIEPASPKVVVMRASGVSFAVFGGVAGIIQGGRMRAEIKKIDDFNNATLFHGTADEEKEKFKELQKNADNAAVARNLMYFMASVGVSLFTLSYFF
ncbi:MAG: hypothetical protein FWB94_03100 [Chitinispirillia bacterium]|nr:hypothetical protein [Chitinispirillia bacterium]